MLLKPTYYSSLNQISQKLEVSKRSIYYDICKLNEWLEYYNVSGLKVVRGKGIFIDENNKSGERTPQPSDDAGRAQGPVGKREGRHQRCARSQRRDRADAPRH